MSTSAYPLLEGIDAPTDLRALEPDALEPLSGELRRFLIDTVAATGGHFAANLGTVELSIALHYCFETPHDRLVWDVGHQSYPHKILTGRREAMSSIRLKGGLAGFPKRDESEYDSFGVGHSSTSLSAALGMALGARTLAEDRRVVAVIGDGAMTAGMAYEALNHAGDLKADMLVILNDNEMSISPNVGAMHKMLNRALSGRIYSSMREGSKRLLDSVPPVRELARRAEEHVKGMVAPGTLFEELGFNYYGPVDGHDVLGLVQMLRNLRTLRGPRLLHVITKKGKGYALAEADPCGYHGVGKFDPAQGMQGGKGGGGPTYTQVFGNWLCDMAARDPKLVGITPAMREGSGLVRFSEAYPERYYDVGIAEQHAVTLAAGLACEGAHPVVAIYSTFLQRAYDQLIHDVAIQDLPVLFAIDRAGLVGPDGPTHAGAFDLAYLRCVPNLVVMTPCDENECRQMLYTGHLHDGPAAVRYPRGKGPGAKPEAEMQALQIGRGRVLRQGRRVALLGFGSPVAACLEAAEALDATVADMRFVKPLDLALLRELAASHELLVTVEDGTRMGGAGSAVAETLAAADDAPRLLILGLPDAFLEHGAREELLSDSGLDAAGIERAIHEQLPEVDCPAPASRVIS